MKNYEKNIKQPGYPPNTDFWQDLKTLPELGSKITIANPEQADTDGMKVLVTFCPLYSPGNLEESKLMPVPANIEASRVAGKWEALQHVLGALAHQTSAAQKNLSLTAVFANKGVLLGAEPTNKDLMNLVHHGELYRDEIGKLCAAKSIELAFADYDDLDVSFPVFVNPNSQMPEVEAGSDSQTAHPSEGGEIITALNRAMTKLEVPTQLRQNKSTRQKVNALIEAFGADTTYWLVAGYLAFDYKIPELVGEDGVYLSLERFAPIFRIANLTPKVRQMTRLEITA